MVVKRRPHRPRSGAKLAQGADSRTLRDFFLDNLESHPGDIVRLASETFGLSRQAMNKQLRKLVREGVVAAAGRTRAIKYRFVDQEANYAGDVSDDFDEHQIWKIFVEPLILDCPDNVQQICHYGVTEMLNNVKDHSGSPDYTVVVARNPRKLEIRVFDFGIGIFEKIRSECRLDDVRDAVFQLHKGKLTTDPKHHTGEGIFFTSRMFDNFGLLSGDLDFSHDRDRKDWLLHDKAKHVQGTGVFMAIDPRSLHTTQEIFDRFASAQDEIGFDKTHVHVRLAESPDERFVSRSQAKRVMSHLSKFREIVLNLGGIPEIGPAFADEIFRVYRLEHPEQVIRAIEAVPKVLRMIAKAETER